MIQVCSIPRMSSYRMLGEELSSFNLIRNPQFMDIILFEGHCNDTAAMGDSLHYLPDERVAVLDPGQDRMKTRGLNPDIEIYLKVDDVNDKLMRYSQLCRLYSHHSLPWYFVMNYPSYIQVCNELSNYAIKSLLPMFAYLYYLYYLCSCLVCPASLVSSIYLYY